MNKFFLILGAVSLFLFNSCATKETVITGKIVGNVTKVAYSNPNEGICYAGFRDTVTVDENGNFELRFQLKQPTFIFLWNSGKQCKLLLESGNKYHVLFDAENVEISGANEEGHRLYATFPNPSFISMQARSFENENSLTGIREKINEMKGEELRQFQKLLDDRKISASFFEIICRDRNCYYASLECSVSQAKISHLIQNEKKPYILENGDNLIENLKNIYTQYPPNGADLLISSFWSEYAQDFIENYNLFLKEDFDIQSARELYESGTWNTFIVNESKKHLTGKNLEVFWATYIYQKSIQLKFEKELISLFEQLEKDYPKSEYSKYIKPFIDKIVDYHDKIENSSENIVFVENYENINTLAEVVKSLKGKKIYVDVWASWCGPCKKEFDHSEALKKILKDKDVQMLYISIDMDGYDSKWKELIKYYNLEGMHMRANLEFHGELAKIYNSENTPESFSITIPWYILIDEDGNIIQKEAKRPSQIVSGEDLF